MTNLVRDLFCHMFEESDRAEALFYLSQITESVRESERIQIAAIKWANGSLSDLAGAIDQANYDWRDLLMGVDFGHDTSAHLKWAQSQLIS